MNYSNLRILQPPVIESCNVSGTIKDSFAQGEPVYINGSGLAPFATYDLYVVNDVDNWVNGTSIPARVPDTAINVSTDVAGTISPAVAWSDPQTFGSYDMIVDLNGNGVYDAGIDILDNNDILVTAGFVIPEFASAATLAMLFIATTLSVAARRKSRK
jgi:hypothetical protein